MTTFTSSRSRHTDGIRCPRARWLGHERLEGDSEGLESVKVALPLATGGSVHVGLQTILTRTMESPTARLLVYPAKLLLYPQWIEEGVTAALADFDSRCEGRGFQLDELEDRSYVYNEQKALTEALTRLAGMRVIPRLLETYEVLEVERPDQEVLYQDTNDDDEPCQDPWEIMWRSIPDALLRARDSGDLYVLSWKTTAQYDARKDSEDRVAMAQASEPWALQTRLTRQWNHLHDPENEVFPGGVGKWVDDDGTEDEMLTWLAGLPAPPRIRGTQMVYLVKGVRRQGSQADSTPEQLSAGVRMKKTASPLIYGYQDKSFPPKLAWGSEWRCSVPHPMRKSSWYPTGECPGDGRNHKRGDDWQSFPVWTTLGVKDWMEALNQGKVTPEAGDPLEAAFAIPVPHFLDQGTIAKWKRQVTAKERRYAQVLAQVREYETALAENPGDDKLRETLERVLDELIPQDGAATGECYNSFGRPCQFVEICWGPEHVRRDPVGSGLYQVRRANPRFEMDKAEEVIP